MDRAEIVHQKFLNRLTTGDLPPVDGPSLSENGLGPDMALACFRAQVISRQLDRMSRQMQARGQGFYTIGSSGHEGNAAIAMALRPTDPAFLHYRDAAFQIARAGQVPDQDPLYDMLLSFAASSDDPISGGRHKVLGSKVLSIPPQTSTIASHLPKAMGTAFAIGMGKRVPTARPAYPQGAIAMASFGDASLNHSTAQGALNTAGWTAFQNTPMPLMLVCEDNGIGISVKSPRGWVAASLSARPGLRYVACDGLDIGETFAKARALADWIRHHRKPGILHMKCVRLYGHAGPDVESAYRPQSEIDAAEANDPLIHSAARLIRDQIATPGDIVDIYQQVWVDTEGAVERVNSRPKLQTAEQVAASIIPPKRDWPRRNSPDSATRAQMLGKADLRALEQPQPMNKLINLGLADLMLQTPEIVVAGEDVGAKGGVYGVTKGLQAKFGKARVIDTLLDEQSILGLAIGMGQAGYIPMPEIQFLAYLHNAEDQLRGEAATLPFFSNGQFSNPMVLRIAGLGYQKGFGGHFHNDNALGVLRDIPGLVIGCPSNGADAVAMYRNAVQMATEQQRVVVMIEPIALYPMRDLHAEGDGAWMTTYPDADHILSPGQLGVYGQGQDLAILTYGNGVYLSRQAQKILSEQGVDARIIDLRWLAPLDHAAILQAVGQDPVLVVDECRESGSLSEALITLLATRKNAGQDRLTATDCFIATGPAYGATLPSRDGIVGKALEMLGK